MSGHLRLSNLEASNINVGFISSDLLPSDSNISLGSSTNPFKELYVSANTLHVGSVSLGEENGVFKPSAAMQFGSDESSKVTIGEAVGISIGTTTMDNTGIKIKNEAGIDTVIDSTLFTTVTTIAKQQATTQANKNIDDFGFLTDYTMNIESTSNNIVSINNGNFELGKLFNSDDSYNLNTYIESVLSYLPSSIANDGTVSLFTEQQKNFRLNKALDNNDISVKLDETKKIIIPVERNTTIRDVFPLNIFDLNKQSGRNKFKADFDNTGSLYFSASDDKLSGVCNLKNYAQLSDPQFVSLYNLKSSAISLSKYEYIVDFITYYNLPILFEAQKQGDDLSTYEYYLSSLIDNRKTNTLYQQSGAASVTENVFGNNSQISTITTRDASYHLKNFYPAIRVMKWKNKYAPTFNTLDATDYTNLKTDLKWTTIQEIYTKYTTGTNTRDNWISKLVELTFQYIKYGKPLKPLNAEDTISVSNIVATISSDPASFMNLDTDNLEITLKSIAFNAII